MSNENKDWKLERILESLDFDGGDWKYIQSLHHIDKDKFVNERLGLTLSVAQAFELIEAGYNAGYNSALRHIRGICDKELEE